MDPGLEEPTHPGKRRRRKPKGHPLARTAPWMIGFALFALAAVSAVVWLIAR